jgi:hypothetical protein
MISPGYIAHPQSRPTKDSSIRFGSPRFEAPGRKRHTCAVSMHPMSMNRARCARRSSRLPMLSPTLFSMRHVDCSTYRLDVQHNKSNPTIRKVSAPSVTVCAFHTYKEAARLEGFIRIGAASEIFDIDSVRRNGPIT